MLIGLFPVESLLPVYIAIVISTLITGIAIGKFINLRIKQLPLYHAFGIAILAAIYKFIRPDFYPVTTTMLIIFVGLTFLSILAGTYVTTNKSA